MSESTSTRGAAPGAPADPGPPTSTRGLKRLLWILVAATAVILVAFGVIYYLGQHADAGPSMADRSVAAAEEAVTASPNDISARLALAGAYTEAGRNEEALSQYAEIIKAQEDNRTALLGAGMILYRQGEYASAKPYYEKVIEFSGGEEFSSIDPQLQSALYYLGVVSLQLNDDESAITNLEAALEIDKTDADAWYTLGDVQLRSGNAEKAAAAYEQALAFVPVGWCEPYSGLEGAYSQMGKTDGVTYAKAMGEICNGENETGLAELESLTEGDFAIPAMLGLGLAAESSGDLESAVAWYTKVTALQSDNVPALTALARLGETGGGAHATADPDPTESAS